jgi:NAD(P)-dependent dehydrogenase (short-subunit alcohol dehydrogenase family)
MTTGNRLRNKVAIVTGAGTRGSTPGTGQAASTLFCREGANVLLVDMDVERAEKTLAEIKREGGQASFCNADVTNEDDCRAMIETCLDRYGALHVLLNNVGTYGRGMVTEIQEADWDHALTVNLKSVALACKHAVPAMDAAGGGSIINVSSIDGMRAGSSRNVPYAAAKGGVIALTKQMAVHHGRQNIRVNCLAPGHVHASFVSHIPDEKRQLRRKAGPLGTEGTAWDVAWAAVFLASDEARWISGVVLPIDAGLLAATPLAVLDNLL